MSSAERPRRRDASSGASKRASARPARRPRRLRSRRAHTTCAPSAHRRHGETHRTRRAESARGAYAPNTAYTCTPRIPGNSAHRCTSSPRTAAQCPARVRARSRAKQRRALLRARGATPAFAPPRRERPRGAFLRESRRDAASACAPVRCACGRVFGGLGRVAGALGRQEPRSRCLCEGTSLDEHAPCEVVCALGAIPGAPGALRMPS
ncbi:uncharacterized protein TRAVEDRAFT_29288 [Trametes versicolor FP-101664 SS1]|uniref:uncharacterized protein n=1 Tax=Trametes versicolor (strain FP-101664) TaxID=717944 RepID=UPI0004624211|nr:uncharacterized protein TRAVEDRAFT_29288 [Trametes versicolor FP-101664 SS1]EIW58839.1 hypothetical protein TRAVEDRAFT_29288 [Trametes versicolor FP-101664 SS1]